MHEVWARFTALRGDIDVTADDAAIDGSTSGFQLTDLTVNRPTDTSKGVSNLPLGAHMVQVGFYAEGYDDSMSFGCELWVANPQGPAQKVCDVTGTAGGDWADFTAGDNTTRLFYDDISASDTTLWGDVTTRNLLSNGMGLVEFSSRGYTYLFPRFYNVGDLTEAKRIKALMRAY